LKSRTIILYFLAVETIFAARVLAQNPVGAVADQQGPRQSTAPLPESPDKAGASPRCETTGTHEITIRCTYTPSSQSASDPKNAPRIVLNHAELSFETKHESYMLVELEFTNEGASLVTPAPTVYLAIDDEAGRNVVRRALPHVDLSKLHPGAHLTFSERFLVGAFTGGHYRISLWIPDPEPSRKDTAAYNLLLNSAGVPEPTTGLNRIAQFSVAPSMHSSRDK